MNQKQYHSLEELPLMMNMTDVAAVLGISRAGATNSSKQAALAGVESSQDHFHEL